MRRLTTILIATTMLATACGGADGNDLLGAASSANWCDLAQKVEDSSNALDSPTADGIHEFADQVKASVSAAPAEIKADVEILATFVDDLATALEENDDNVLLAFDSLSSELSDPKFEEAGNRIDAYNKRECGITDPSSADSGSTDTSATDTGSTDVAPPPADNSGGTDLGGDPAIDGGLIASLAQEMGVTEDQARCLISKLDFTASETPPVGEMLNAFTDCGIDPLAIGG